MTDARRTFLRELIDDAGLFPPASLSMDAAAKQHADARRGAHGWMLGRFICPASRLEELRPHLHVLDPWRLSVILDDPATLAAWLEDPPPGTTVEIVEIPPAADPDPAPEGVPRFVEVPREEPLEALLAELAEQGLDAKLRCGGPTAELVPPPQRVAGFIDGCRRHGLRFKATAGLHHPFRHTDPATGTLQHGFVNLVGASVLAEAHDLGPDRIEEVVAETDPAAFALTPDRFAWRDLAAGPDQIRDARRRLFFAYGSCSFDEPVEDLLALGILPA